MIKNISSLQRFYSKTD